MYGTLRTIDVLLGVAYATFSKNEVDGSGEARNCGGSNHKRVRPTGLHSTHGSQLTGWLPANRTGLRHCE